MYKNHMNKINFSFVLPAYNEEKNIARAIEQAEKFLSRRFKFFEIIVVDDGSKDQTAATVQNISKLNKNIRLVRHIKNQGYGAAVWDGLKAARGELVFFTDSDLQFDLSDLSPFLKEIKTCDVVIGYRVKRAEGFRRSINALCWKLVCFAALRIKPKDIDCAFKLFRRDALRGIEIDSLGATFSAELLFRLWEKGCKVVELPVKHLPRAHGKPTGNKISVIIKAFKELAGLSAKTPKLARLRDKRLYIVGIVVLFLSRFLFLSNSRDFFDSSEYLWRLKIPELIKVVTTGHPPYHPMYVGLASLFYKMGITAYDGTTAAIIPSALLGCVSVIFAFLLAKNLFGRKVAWLSTVIYALLPFVYSSQITILVDPTMHGFYLASLYVFALSMDQRGSKSLWLAVLAGILLGGAAFTHTSIAFWITAYLGIWFIKSEKINFAAVKKDYLKFILGAVSACWAIVAYVALLLAAHRFASNDGEATVKDALKYLLLGNSSDHGSISLYLSAKYFLTISTVIVGVLAVLGFLKIIFKNPKNAIGFFIWFVPSTILTANYIYENLHGRAMIPALFPVAILAAIFILSIRKKYIEVLLIGLVVLQVGLLGFSAASRYASKLAPFEQIYLMQKSLESGGVFISSNVTRTFNEYAGKFISFGDVGQGAGEAEKAIDDSLNAGKKAYVSIDAIWYPKRRFDGMFYDIRANAGGSSQNQRTLLNNVFEDKTFILSKMNPLYNQAIYEVSNDSADRTANLDDRAKEHELIFGRVLSDGQSLKVASVSFYQNNFCMTDKNDITYGDWGFCLYRILTGNKNVESWSYTDKDGWFYAPVSSDPEEIELGYSAEQSRLDGDGFFVKTGTSKINGGKVGTFNLGELKEKISGMGSFYAISHVENGVVKYDLYKIETKIEKTDRIEGEDLVSETGRVADLDNASGGSVIMSAETATGYLVSGPYINLAPGKYKVSFRIKSNDNEGKITLDVISNLGKSELTRGEYQASEIAGNFENKDFEFTVGDVLSGKNIEFRVRLEQSAASLDYIELTKID